MKISILLFILHLSTGTLFSETVKPKYGPAEKPVAVPLARDHGYFTSTESRNSDFWKLIPFYVPQFNEYSCAVASVSIVLNGLLLTGDNIPNDMRVITQADILDKVRANHWKERMSKEGYNGQHGLTLSQLEDSVRETLKTYSKSNFTVKRFDASGSETERLNEFIKILVENELDSNGFVLVHFVQDDLTKAPGGPYAHISPIGAYDVKAGRVLILDVDREFYEPYWVSAKDLFSSLTHKTDAYGHGGMIVIKK